MLELSPPDRAQVISRYLPLPSYLQETAASHHVEDIVFIFFILP